MSAFYAKDFIETADGLRFAVVKSELEYAKVLCFLRYVLINGQWQKLNTDTANQFLKQNYPHYLHYSKRIDAHLHAVPLVLISQHYQPRPYLQQLLTQSSADAATQDIQQLCQFLAQQQVDIGQIGVTGSILLNVQQIDSDIDLVFYERDTFQQARQALHTLIEQQQLQALSDKDWQESYRRRNCDLSFTEYVWHERRKYNKGLINQRKFDLTLSGQVIEHRAEYRKEGITKLVVQISDDSYGFDYPAEFFLTHPQIKSIVSFTATYAGQAMTGEWVEVCGQLETSDLGDKRIVVGSSREAHGEYIKVRRTYL